jgi:O-acetyl-ADP-ribose deacetylase (regulator of RNase III)
VTTEGFWTNASVLALAGDRDPVDVITELSRELVLQAMDEGWSGPPFDPFALADRLGIPVVAREELDDARTVPAGSDAVRIEFNPSRPRGRLRFSVAHELAHTFFPDVAEAVRYRGPRTGADDTWQLELLCNIAASELLMPVGTFETLGREPLDINHLMRLRKSYDVSSEALLRRVVRLTDEPTVFFAASRTGGRELDAAFQLDYFEGSHGWRPPLHRGRRLPPETVLRHCTAVGFTDSAPETWPDVGEVEVQCSGVAPYPGHRFPRVVGLLTPRDGGRSRACGIHYVDGDATQPRADGPKVIAHVVNDRTPNWGGAFARALRDRFPDTQAAFCEWVAVDRLNLSLGHTHVLDLAGALTVASMVTQRGYGASSQPRIAYSALRHCLDQVAAVARERGATVHMPRIGVGMAGGKWSVVRELIDNAFVENGIDVTVYTLPGMSFDEAEAQPLQLSL